ncbi:MAG: hypothetical protein ACI815_001964 [Psychroserpens sp.]|jgi:hypothetical protein
MLFGNACAELFHNDGYLEGGKVGNPYLCALFIEEIKQV